MNTLNYPGTQSALYQIATNVAASLSHYLAPFTAFKPKYNSIYLTALKAQIHAAEILPDLQARATHSEINHINLCQHLTTCCTHYQTLKSYIKAAFPANIHKPRIEEAGSKYYTQASNRNWTAAQALFNSATLFIANHTAILSTANNMPPSFPIAFQDSINLFNQTLIAFQQAKEKIKIDTQIKIRANNQLYKTIIEICLDGQIIFKTNQALKSQFTFSAISQIVSGVGTTGFKGHVINAATSQPIAQATIITTPPTKEIITNPEGYYQFTPIPTGSYTLQITAQGYIPHTITAYQVHTGITHILSIPLQPQP